MIQSIQHPHTAHGVQLHLPLQQPPPHHITHLQNPLFNMNYSHPPHQPNQQQASPYPAQAQEGTNTAENIVNNDSNTGVNSGDDSKVVTKEDEVVMGFGDEEEDAHDDNMVGFGFGNDDDELMRPKASSGGP